MYARVRTENSGEKHITMPKIVERSAGRQTGESKIHETRDAVAYEPYREQPAQRQYAGHRLEQDHHAGEDAYYARDQGDNGAEAGAPLQPDVDHYVEDAHDHGEDAVYDNGALKRGSRAVQCVNAEHHQEYAHYQLNHT